MVNEDPHGRFTRRAVFERGSAVLAWALLPGTGAAFAKSVAGSGGGRSSMPVAMYGVVPFLFGRQGWRSVVAKLGHLGDLGVDTIWLSPVVPTATGGFGYDAISYAHPRRDYGTEAEFRQMITAIHARGMRVILDFPTNDTSDRHPYFLDAQRQGRKSPYYRYYQRDEHGRPVHYFDWKNLPNLNFDNPAVQKWIIAVYCHWLREYGVDGFRVDAAWGVRQRSPSFWPECVGAIRGVAPNALLIAEGSAQDPYYAAAGFDCAYDWSRRIGQWDWTGAFRRPAQTPRRLSADLTATADLPISVLRFLDDNDTGARFLTRHGPALTRLAATFLFALEGLPTLFTGDEVGAQYQPYETQGPINWSGHDDLFSHYRRLITLRRAFPALREGARSEVSGTEGTGVLAFRRTYGRQSIIAIFNFGRQPSHLFLPRPGFKAHPVDLLTGQTVIPRKPGRIEIAAASALLLSNAHLA
jgi:cyclomaltodextrinase / maltogenic alpha-amylase / neopullulanase